MNLKPQPKLMQRPLLAALMTAALSLTAAGALRAATPEPAKASSAT